MHRSDLDEDEAALLLACQQGREWNGENKRIRADFIRDLLLGAHGSPLGVRIRGGAIDGKLGLSRQPIGHEHLLPALRLREVTIKGPIHLNNSRITKLDLANCRITRLQARGAEFAGGVDLRWIRSSRSNPSPGVIRLPGDDHDQTLHECSIDLANSKIDGDVRLNGAVLCVGAPQSDEASIGPKPYALNLRAAEIAGAVRMEPNFFAIGGVTVADARIRGDVRAHGAFLVARYGAAFRGQNVQINGTLFCRSLKQSATNSVENETFTVVSRDEGGIIFQNAEIARVEIDGCKIMQAPVDPVRTPFPAVDFSYARIRGSIAGEPVLLKNGVLTPTRINGQVALIGANIGGDVLLNGAQIDDSEPSAGALSLEADDKAPVAARYALTLRGASVSGTIRISGGFKAFGGFCVADASIGGDIYLSNAHLSAPPGGDALRGRNATIAGVLRGGCGRYASPTFKPLSTVGGIAFPNASMDLVDLSGAQVRSDFPGEARRVRARVDFESAHVRSGFFLCSAPARDDAGIALAGVDPCVHGSVILTDAVIDGDLDLHGLTLDLTDQPVTPASLPAVVASGIKVGGSVAMGNQSPTGGRDGDKTSPFSILAPLPNSENDVARVVFTTAKIGQAFSLAADSVRVLSAANIAVQGEVDIAGPPKVTGLMAVDFSGGVMASSLALSDLRLQTMNAQRLRVGGDLRLTSIEIDGLCQVDRAQIGGHLDLTKIRFLPDPKAVSKGLGSPYPSGRLNAPALYFDGARVAGALRVRDVFASQAGARNVREDLTTATLTEKLDGKANPGPSPHVSLLFMSVGQLDDVAAVAWDRELCLRLKGFAYDAIYFNDRGLLKLETAAKERLKPQPRSGTDWAVLLTPATMTLGCASMVLSLKKSLLPYVVNLIGFRSAADNLLADPLTPWSLSAVALLMAWVTFLVMVWSPGPRAPKVATRLEWLEQQFRADAKQLHRDYHPQPYIQLARTYRLQGLFEFSDTVLEQRVSREVEVKAQRLDAGYRKSGFDQQNVTNAKSGRPPPLRRMQGRLYGWVWKAAAALYKTFFGYGLKPHLAILTFVLCWLTGAVLLDFASLMDLTSETCRKEVSNLVFSLDAFVPLLDLGVANKCSIPMAGPAGVSPDRNLLFALGHFGMTGLTVVGWIVTSLTILTLTGVLRRFAEN